jgi:hypothetical protein
LHEYFFSAIFFFFDQLVLLEFYRFLVAAAATGRPADSDSSRAATACLANRWRPDRRRQAESSESMHWPPDVAVRSIRRPRKLASQLVLKKKVLNKNSGRKFFGANLKKQNVTDWQQRQFLLSHNSSNNSNSKVGIKLGSEDVVLRRLDVTLIKIGQKK